MYIAEQIKKEATVGDILLSFNKKNALSGAIKDLTHGEFSHSFIYIGLGKILESSIHGVAIRPLDYYLDYEKFYVSLRRPDLTPEQSKDFVNFCKSKLGVSYGYLQMGYLGLLYILGLKENTWLNKVDLPGIVCSELIASGLNYVGWYPFGNIDPANVTPKELSDKIVKIV